MNFELLLLAFPLRAFVLATLRLAFWRLLGGLRLGSDLDARCADWSSRIGRLFACLRSRLALRGLLRHFIAWRFGLRASFTLRLLAR